MIKIAYISNLNLDKKSGGGSGVNFATYHQLSKFFKVEKFEPINPPQDFQAKIKSKIRQWFNIPGNYHFFSEKRLKAINSEYLFQMQMFDPDILFFHGFTPWIKTNPSIPYFCFNDACFATYVSIYNDKKRFANLDLQRIYQQEAKWLSNAQKVFFRSQWALEETRKLYNISGDNFLNIGLGGFIEIPESDIFNGEQNFLFISKEFEAKGGRVAFDAFKKVKKEFHNVKLWIVGEKPPNSILSELGVYYKGYFNKENPKEVESLKSIFSQSFSLVHPTLKDTNTLVITELAYFGCPAISSNLFAIPEYLQDKQSGLLLNNPKDVNELAEKMMFLLRNPIDYLKYRKKARLNAISKNTWDKVGERLKDSILNEYHRHMNI